MTGSAFDQSTYQLRLDWGMAGLERLAPADVVVVVDVLGLTARAIEAAEHGRELTMDEATVAEGDRAALGVAGAAGRSASSVVLGGLRNAAAVARHVLALQSDRASRTSVAIVPCGEPDGEAVRFAVEDLLGAGAVVAALGDLGIDHCSPDAAVAGEAFRALQKASRHLLTASGSGLAMDAAGRRDEVHTAAAVNAASLVPVLAGDRFVVDETG